MSRSLTFKAYALVDELWWIALLNACLIVFTLLGIVVLGAAPAGVAAVTLVRRRAKGEKTRIFREFWSVYRAEFWRANRALLPLGAAVWGLTFSWLFFDAQRGTGFAVLSAMLLVVLVCLVLIACTATVLHAHYNVVPRAVPFLASRFLVVNPLLALLSAVILGAVAFASWLLPGLIPFFSAGLIAYLVSRVALDFFDRNERRLEQAPVIPAHAR